MNKDQSTSESTYPKITEDPNYATMATLPGLDTFGGTDGDGNNLSSRRTRR